MARKVKITSYIKNLGHSLGYVVSDVVGDYVPTAKSIISDTKSTYQEIKFSMQDIKNNNISNAVKSFKSDSNIISNTLDDLASGKWYNKEREEEAMNDMFGFDFDIDDFGSEDWGDDDSENSDTGSIIEHDEMDTREVIGSIGKATDTISKSVGYATAESAKYVVKNNNAASKALYDLNAKGFNQVSSILLNMNDTMVGLVKLSQPLASHMQNSAMFFTNTTETLNKMNENLSILVKRTEYMENTPDKKVKDTKNGYERFMSGGQFDLSSYIDMVKENVKDKSDTIKSMTDMIEMMIGKNGKNTSLTQLALKFGVDKLIPQITKDIAKQFDEALSDTLGNGLMRLGKAGRKKTGIISFLADIFLPKENIKNSINLSNYEKGPMQWDGIARQSLTYVIPTYLAQMTALLAGVDDQNDYQYYDFKSGKFISKKVYKVKREKTDRDKAKRAGGDFEREALKSANDVATKKDIEEFFYQAMMKGGDFYNIRKGKTDKAWREKYGNISDEALDILIRLYEESYSKGPNKNRNNARKMEADMNAAIAQRFRDMQEEEASGTSFLTRFYDDSDAFIYAPSLGGGYAPTSRGRGRKGQKIPTQPRSRYNTKEKQAINKRGAYKLNDDGTYTVGANNVILKEKDFNRWLEAFNEYDEDLMKKIEDTEAMNSFAKKIKSKAKEGATVFGTAILTNGEEKESKDGSIIDKLKKVKDVIQAPIYAATLAMDSLSRGLNKLFYGENGKGGVLDTLKTKISETWDKISERFGSLTKAGRMRKVNALGGVPEGTVDLIPDQMNMGIYFALNESRQTIGSVDAQVANAWFDANRKRDSLKESMRKEWDNIKQKVKDKFTGENAKAIKEQYELFKNSEGFDGYGAGSGLRRISGGDSDISMNMKRVGKSDLYSPDNYKTYYKRDENGKFVKLDNKENGKEILKGLGVAAKESDAVQNIKEGGKKLVDGVGDFFSKTLYGDEKTQNKDKKAISETLQKVFKDVGDSKGAMAIGAITGAGVSLLTGAIVGPLAGAAIGAGVGLAAKSQAFQNFLFGEGDPNDPDNYKKGLLGDLGKKLKDPDNQAILKSAGIGGGIGLVGGTLMGSPILGMIAGSTVGYIAKSEKAKKFLFGTEEERTGLGKLKDKIKKAAPNIAAGSMAGLLIGPFGLVGNLLVGGSLGFITSTSHFHKFLFGDEDGKNKDEKRGLAGILHDKIIDPIDNIMHNIKNSTKQWLKNMGKSLGRRISSFFKDRVKRYKDGERGGLTGVIGKVDSVLRAPVNLAGKALGAIDNATAKSNLKNGYDVWNAKEKRNATAEERIQMRVDKDMKESSLDKAIASIDNKEDLLKLQSAIRDLQDPSRIFKSAKSKEINELYKVLEENGVPSKVADKIVDYTKGEHGDTRATNYLDGLMQNEENSFDVKNIDDVRNAIMKSNENIRNAKNDKNITLNTKQMLKDKFGLDTKDFSLMNADALINSELKNNKKFSDEKQAEQKLDKHNSVVETYLDQILNAIQGVKDAGTDKFNKDNAGRITVKEGKDGRKLYRTIDENGEEHVISKENALKALAENKNRTVGEKLYDAKDAIGKGIKTGAEVTGEVIVEAGKELGKAAATIASAVGSIASFIGGQVGEGIAEADESVANAREISDYTGGKLSRAGRKVENAGKRVGGFVKGALSESSDETTEEAGSGSAMYRNIIKTLSGGDSEDTKTEFTSNGPVQYVKNNQGEWTVDNTDTETKNTMKKQNAFNESIGGISKISGLLGKFGGILGAIKTGLLGDKKEKKEGILSKLFSGLFGDSGVFTGLFSLFTGKTGKLGTLIKTVLGGGSGVLSGIFSTIVAPALLVGGFAGLFDNLFKVIGNLPLLKGNDTESTIADNKSTQVTTTDGTTTYLQTNEDGSYVTDDNGNYVGTNGESISKDSIQSTNVSEANTSHKANLVRNTISGTINGLARTSERLAAGNTKGALKALSRSSKVTKTASKAGSVIGKKLNKIAGEAVNAGLYNGLMANFKKLLEKIPKVLNAIPFLPDSVAENADTIVESLYKHLDDAAKKAGKKLASIAANLSKVLSVVQAVYIIAKGIDAWGNAGSILGITDEPTVLQRTIATLLAVANAAIPVIGDLIPNKVLVNIFVELAPKILPDFDISEFTKQRDDAEKEVEQFNKENGTDLSIEEYNQAGWEYNEETGEYTQGKSRAGIFTKAGNKIKSFFTNKKLKNGTTSTSSTSTSTTTTTTSGSGSGLADAEETNTSKYKDIFSKITNSQSLNNKAFKKDTNTFISTLEQLKKYAEDGKIKNIMSTTANFSDDNPISGLYEAGIGISKIFQTISGILYNIVNPIKKVINTVKETTEKIKNSAFKTLKKFLNVIFGDDSDTSGSGSGLSISGGASGFVSQYDPRYQQLKVSGQDFGAKGCGPAVASMAASAMGRNLSVNDAVKASNGYQNQGGVTLDYFQNALGSKGINTEIISGGSSADMYSRIASGQNMILLGQDSMNTSKEYSPFGPNNHYVLATGVDKRGNVIVNDPESRAPRTYSPQILANAKYGVAAGGSGRRKTKRSKVASRFSRISGSNSKLRNRFRRISGGASGSTDPKQIWDFLRSNGFNEYACAGIMGCWQQESGCNPTTVEGYYLGSYPGDDVVLASKQSMSDYCQNVLFPAYSISINRAAYMDSDGYYLPGCGLAQWTGPNVSLLMDWCNSNGYDWRTLAGQLNYFWNDIQGKSTAKSKMDNATSVSGATADFMDYYEMGGSVGFHSSHSDWYNARVSAGENFYNQYSGSSITTSIDGSSSGDSSDSSDEDSGIIGVLSTISSAFSNAFSGTSSSSSSSSSSDSSSSSGSTSSDQQKVVDQMASWKGKLYYSQDYTERNTDPDESGAGDCSSTVNWAYKKALGVDIGGFSGSQITSDQTYVVASGGTSPSEHADVMQPGDIILYGDENGNNGGHSEMYAGNGIILTHGGPDRYDMGPVERDLATRQHKGFNCIKRYIGFKDSGSGSGIRSYDELAMVSGGSSGLLMNSRAGSASAKGIAIRDPRNGRLVPIRVSGGDSDITDVTTSMLNNVKYTATNSAKSGTISSDLVTKLLESITGILNSIATNTAPVDNIYRALVAYINSTSGGGAAMDKVAVRKTDSSKQKQVVDNSSTVDSNISTLVGVLAELAKG